MQFDSFTFLAFFALVLAGYNALRDWGARKWLLLVASYVFYSAWNPPFLLLLLGSTTLDWLVARRIDAAEDPRRRKLWVIATLLINLGVLGYFKYSQFLLDNFAAALASAGINYAPPAFDIVLPIGISFYTFQALSYSIDVYREKLAPTRDIVAFFAFISFFPQLVAGPIVRARDFIPQIYKTPVVTRAEFGEGLFLVLCGLFKKTVISDYISLNFVDRIFDAPLLYTGVENLLGVYGYALQIYCDFSGYSDMAIGIALLLGFRFNVNFDSPYQSATITEFWRRWHISLSSWLKDYLYISLGGNRKGKIRTYINLLITMLLGGLWHGASVSFILWGALHGVALAVHKFVMNHFSSFKPLGSEMKPWRRVIGVLITFHLVCFGWILFRADSMQTVGEVLTQIFTNFHPEVFMQFVVGYKGVFVLMVVGYILHFLPKSAENSLQAVVTRSPLLVQAVMLAIAIFVVVQFKSAGVQPFIYFQF